MAYRMSTGSLFTRSIVHKSTSFLAIRPRSSLATVTLLRSPFRSNAFKATFQPRQQDSYFQAPQSQQLSPLRWYARLAAVLGGAFFTGVGATYYLSRDDTNAVTGMPAADNEELLRYTILGFSAMQQLIFELLAMPEVAKCVVFEDDVFERHPLMTDSGKRLRGRATRVQGTDGLTKALIVESFDQGDVSEEMSSRIADWQAAVVDEIVSSGQAALGHFVMLYCTHGKIFGTPVPTAAHPPNFVRQRLDHIRRLRDGTATNEKVLQ